MANQTFFTHPYELMIDFDNSIYNEQRQVRAGYPRIPYKVALHRTGLLGTMEDPRNIYDRQDELIVEIKEEEDRYREGVLEFIDMVLDQFNCTGKMSVPTERAWAWLVHTVREGPWPDHVTRRLFAPEHGRALPFHHAMESIIVQRCAARRDRGHVSVPGWYRKYPNPFPPKIEILIS